jgi:DNA-binding CsgD family transcriptional regulator
VPNHRLALDKMSICLFQTATVALSMFLKSCKAESFVGTFNQIYGDAFGRLQKNIDAGYKTHVVDANAGAGTEGFFDEDIRIINRRLVARDAEAKSNLEKLANRLRVTPDTATLPCEPIVIPRRDKSPVILRILPVHGAARTPFLGARALLSLTAVEARPGPKPALLASAFGLTPAEARLASIVAEGLNPERAADELRISKVTARNQLKAIFAKTGTHRQSELVGRLSRI